MSYGVTLYNVFIASPSDVAWAREQIRKTVYSWNEVNTKHHETVLFPRGWETSSAPSMSGPAQQIINDTLLSEADILVGVFWTRLGTPTAEFESGTVEEIERHIAAGKKTLLYFSAQPVTPDSIDHQEYERLKQFKTSLQTRGLYRQFDSQAEFAEVFAQHLGMHVNELIGARAVNVSEMAAVGTPSMVRGLSAAAKFLLKEAAKDPHGTVIYYEGLGESEIETNDKSFINDGNAREVAKWVSALRELVTAGFLLDTGKSVVFNVTADGYEYADSITE